MCIVINFLVLLPICLSSSFVYFNNGPEYLTDEIVQVFIPLQSLLLRSVLVHPRYSFLIFSFLVWRCLLLVSPSTCSFPFLQTFWFLLAMEVLFLRLFIFSHLSLWAWHIFLCQILSLYFGCIFLLFVSKSSILFIFCRQVDVVHVHIGSNIF